MKFLKGLESGICMGHRHPNSLQVWLLSWLPDRKGRAHTAWPGFLERHLERGRSCTLIRGDLLVCGGLFITVFCPSFWSWRRSKMQVVSTGSWELDETHSLGGEGQPSFYGHQLPFPLCHRASEGGRRLTICVWGYLSEIILCRDVVLYLGRKAQPRQPHLKGVECESDLGSSRKPFPGLCRKLTFKRLENVATALGESRHC